MKYYLEICSVDSQDPYDLQTRVFDTVEECESWAKENFDYVNECTLKMFIMSIDENGDIDQVKELN